MRVTTAFLSNLGIAVPGSSPENGDAILQIPPIVLGAIEPIFPTLKISGSGAVSDSSINVGVGVNRTNQGASTGTLITFSKGLYELDAWVSARYNFSSAAGSAPHSSLSLYEPSGSQANPLVSFFAVSGVASDSRKIRVLFAQDGWQVRLVYGATGVGENLDMISDLHVTKIL